MILPSCAPSGGGGFGAGFLSVVCKLQGISESALETLGSTGLFEGVGSSSSSRNDPNPTVRRYIADLKPKITVEFAERSKAPVSGTGLFGGVGSNPTPITIFL